MCIFDNKIKILVAVYCISILITIVVLYNTVSITKNVAIILLVLSSVAVVYWVSYVVNSSMPTSDVGIEWHYEPVEPVEPATHEPATHEPAKYEPVEPVEPLHIEDPSWRLHLTHTQELSNGKKK